MATSHGSARGRSLRTKARETMTDHRLRRSADVRAALRSGLRLHGTTMVLHVRGRGDADPARWTVIAGRKVGSAVRRNRAKRRLRAVLRTEALPPGTDVVAVARPAVLDVAFTALRAEVSQLLERTRGRPAEAQA